MPVNSTSAALASSTTASAATTNSAATAASAASASFSEGDFLKLLMAQMSNQDPLNPTDSTQFVTQLATFSQVEQSVQQSTQLTNMSSQLQALNNTNSAGLVGATVTLQNTSMQWNGSTATSQTSATVTLSGAAQSVNAAVLDSNGNTVQTIKLGPAAAGPLPISWNGTETSGQPAPNGTYTLNVSATAANGQSVPVTQSVTGVVQSISYSQGTPSVVLNNGASAPVSQLTNVSAGNATSGSGTTTTP
jgi:flagellar basal-body rod modification protein FlgD